MDVLEYIDVIKNFMLPIVLWNMIVSVIVMERVWIYHDGRAVLIRVHGALNAQIYWYEILQHHVFH